MEGVSSGLAFGYLYFKPWVAGVDKDFRRVNGEAGIILDDASVGDAIQGGFQPGGEVVAVPAPGGLEIEPGLCRGPYPSGRVAVAGQAGQDAGSLSALLAGLGFRAPVDAVGGVRVEHVRGQG